MRLQGVRQLRAAPLVLVVARSTDVERCSFLAAGVRNSIGVVIFYYCLFISSAEVPRGREGGEDTREKEQKY